LRSYGDSTQRTFEPWFLSLEDVWISDVSMKKYYQQQLNRH